MVLRGHVAHVSDGSPLSSCIVSWLPSLLVTAQIPLTSFSPLSILVLWWDLKDLWIITYPLSNWGLACYHIACLLALNSTYLVVPLILFFPSRPFSHSKPFTIRMKELLEVILMGRRISVT